MSSHHQKKTQWNPEMKTERLVTRQGRHPKQRDALKSVRGRALKTSKEGALEQQSLLRVQQSPQKQKGWGQGQQG